MTDLRSSIVITIFSTASGVGKTFLAVNMAAELAKLGQSVCVIDLDLQFGDVCNYLKLSPQFTISDAQYSLESSPETFQVSSFLTTYKSGTTKFSVLPPPKTISESYAIQSETLTKIIADLNNFDFVIVDTSKIFSELNLTALDLSTIITFLCVADFVPAIKNLKMGYETLHRFNYDKNKIRLIQNRSDSQKLILTEDVEKVLGDSFYYNLPNDFAAAQKSIEAGRPLVLNNSGALAESLKILVGKYTNRHVEAEQVEKNSSGFISWIKNIFSK